MVYFSIFHPKNLRLRLLSIPSPSSSLHTRSLLPYKDKPTNWNSTHVFVLSNPLLSLLEKKCNSMTHLKQIQAQMIVTGLFLDGLATSRLVAFCAISQMGDINYCMTLLRDSRNMNTFSWNVSIRGYGEKDQTKEAVLLYKYMLRSRSIPDNYTYPLLLKSCSRLSSISVGNQIMSHVLKLGFHSDIFVHNALIHLLVSFGELDDARKVFDESCVRDLVSWNSLINGYVRGGLALEGLALYREMLEKGIFPDEVTMIGVVSSCAQLEDLGFGSKCRQYIDENGLNLTVPLANALMDMYVKCGKVELAKALFDNMSNKTMVSWTTMIVGYSKVGLLETARKLFDEMPEKDVVPWNAMINGYVHGHRFKEALSLIQEMLSTNVKPDEVTMVSCLSASSQLGALDIGIWIHNYVKKEMLSLNVALGTALVDMYAKCGNMPKALDVFNEMSVRNSLTWTVIVDGLALHGNPRESILYFSRMIDIGLMPDEITFLAVLKACCHGGLVEEGRKLFSEMSSTFKLTPSLKHYSCMVDLLGRAGKLDEAEELISNMPMEADAVVWGSLFFACGAHKNLDMGERVAKKLIELDPHDSGIYVLLANMYGEAKMWEKAGKVRKMMREKGVEKTPGCSLIEVNGRVFEFIVRDKSHFQSERIFDCLDHLTKQLEVVDSACGTSLMGQD